MSAAQIDATKVLAYAIIGGSQVQIQAPKVLAYAIVDPSGTGPAAPARRRAHVRVTRKTVTV